MKKSLILCLITVVSVGILAPTPIRASEEGRRNVAYLTGVLLGGAIYTGNPYAIGATGSGTLYSLKRLGDEINNRHQREKYYQPQARQPQNCPSPCQQPAYCPAQYQQVACCPTCGQSQTYSNCGPRGQNCSVNQPPQYVYYPTTAQCNNYDSRDPDELIPNTASESSHQNFSVGYNGNNPTFRFNRSGGQRTSYVRRGNKQKQSQKAQKVIVVYVDANGYPIQQNAGYQPQPTYQRDPDQLVPVSASDSSHQNFSVGYNGNNPTSYLNRSGGQRISYARRGNLRN
ncbi:MAG: hypothetical protein WC536_00540 [Patescibacteria group bacterium]